MAKIKVEDLKELFPFDKVEVYSKTLGCTVPFLEAEKMNAERMTFSTMEISHFSVINGVVVAYTD